MRFKIPYDLPVARKRVTYTEITNATHFAVLKYLATQDHQLIASMFDDLIAESTQQDPRHMFVLDKFCLLMEMRTIALGDRVELKASKARATITLSSILQSLISSTRNIDFQHEIMINDVVVTTHMPRKFIANDVDDIINNCIYTIQHDGQVHAFDNMTVHEQNALVNSLPADVTSKIVEHIRCNKQSTASINIIQANEIVGLEAFPLDVYDASLLVFLKSMYQEDLMNFYEMQYNIIKKLELTNDHFMSMSPNESRIFVNLHNKDMKKQQEEEAKSKKSHGKPIGGI